ncbi:LAFA_0C08790g1_1 [Lachancea sp. 'fantastica']|nr:LAFA_0C08790g1_1 [Lachancea sp. 'fantastica']
MFADVVCGWSHMVVIEQNGTVSTAGIGDKGELGQFEVRKSPKFTPIHKLQNLEKAQVFACFYNTYVLDNCQLYGCGSNTKCQLKDVKSRVVDTLEVVGSFPVASACVGKNFVCFVDTTGELHIRGALASFEPQMQQKHRGMAAFELKAMWTSITSQCGQDFAFFGTANQNQNAVVESQFDKPVTAWNTGSEHGVVCLDRKTVFCWGWGEHGNCGPIATSKVIDGINDGSNINSGINLTYDIQRLPDATVYDCFGGCATTWICVEIDN